MRLFIQVVKNAAYRHGYLLLIAAWLYTISFVFTNYWSYSSSPQKVKNSLENYIATQEQTFHTLIHDSSYLHTILSNSSSFNNDYLQSLPFGLFAYRVNSGNNLVQLYWNTSQMAVNTNDFKDHDGNFVVQHQNGLFELLKRTITLKNEKYIIAGLVPLYWHYSSVENNYLHSQFGSFKSIDKLYRLSTDRNAIAIKNSFGTTLFHIELINSKHTEQPDGISITLRLITILLLLFFFSAIAQELYLHLSFYKGLLFLVSALLIFRLFVYYSPFPFYLNTLDLFTPPAGDRVIFNTSLGDLLFNIILFFQVVSFVFFFRNKPVLIRKKLVRVIAVILLVLQAWLTILFCDVVKSLIYNSGVSFEVNNFFNLSGNTIAGLVVLAAFIICFYYFSWLVVLPSLAGKISLFERITITVTAGLLVLSFSIQSSTLSQKIAAIVWLVVLLILQEYRQSDKRITLIRSSFFLIWIMFFSFSVSALFVVQKKDYELSQRKNLAMKLSEEIDPYSINVLKMATHVFEDSSINSIFPHFYNLYENRNIKDSLLSTNFSGYLSKYDTHIYTFDNNNRPLYNDDNTSYFAFNRLLDNLSVIQKSTTIPGLYFIDDKSSDFSYIYQKDIVVSDSLAGHIVITASPKPFKREAIYPALFRQQNSIDDAMAGATYAIYKGRHLIDYSNDYAFPDTLLPSQVPILQFEQRKGKDDNELWYKGGNSRIVILVNSNTAFAEFLTLFAALFTIVVLLIILYEVGSFILRARFEKKDFRKAISLNIRSQVQTTIIGISIFSFIIIGVVTINFFINQFNKNTKAKLARSVQVMVNEIQEAIQNNLMFDNFDSISNNSELEKRVIEIANLNNADVNLYNTNGDLQITTQPDIYNKHILSNKMQPDAYYHLHQLHNILFTQKEYIKRFSFESVYKPIKGDDGRVLAYINIPYLNSQAEVNGEISNLLVTLIFSNAVIFVLAGIIALLLTHRITSSLELIGNKLKALHLGGKNEQITWHRKDEISVLVNEYNKMVRQLEASAEALARSERAGAWQEMARQVAHEIKNPLTPMKLSIQYLQRAINNNSPNVKELSQRVAETLVEQIDQLAQIAGDFSQFANINHVKPVHFNLSEMLESLAALHESDSHVQIKCIPPAQACYVYADKTQINRLFTNLIKNAEEASEGEVAEIRIKQHNVNKNVIITITDKGTGIPEDKKAHIFEPNFTTKSSGTGLGLAICKGIVEKAHGKIWFTTKEGIGTTFYVELPLSTNTLIAV